MSDLWEAYVRHVCYTCGKQETYANEFYIIGNNFFQHFCWDCWERHTGQKLDRSRKPPRKEEVNH